MFSCGLLYKRSNNQRLCLESCNEFAGQYGNRSLLQKKVYSRLIFVPKKQFVRQRLPMSDNLDNFFHYFRTVLNHALFNMEKTYDIRVFIHDFNNLRYFTMLFNNIYCNSFCVLKLFKYLKKIFLWKIVFYCFLIAFHSLLED